MRIAFVLLVAGRGSRMRGAVDDKCRWPLAGHPVWCHSLRTFARVAPGAPVVVVCRDAQQQAALAAEAPAGLPICYTFGGEERQDSVRAGLEATDADIEAVLIHDGARPLVSAEAIQAMIARIEQSPAVCLAHRVTDTIKRVPTDPVATGGAVPLEDLDRATLWAMETPQGFHRELILRAYRETTSRITDDTAAVARYGVPVALVENLTPNPKLTTPDDLAWLEYLLSRHS